jgi:hypothetical protein
MHRCWLLLLMVTTMMADEVAAAPAIEFRELEWWVTDHHGRSGWIAGGYHPDHPDSAGRIEDVRLVEPQQLVWQRGYHDIEAVRSDDRGATLVGFSKGTLRLVRLDGRRWQVEFIPLAGTEVRSVFRTFGPGDEVVVAAPLPPFIGEPVPSPER